ncbi:MAG: Lrp/AsnC ligand binding domain-containing protein [Elusimicrobiota bacterium]|nr:Lrp/AsnC ligand binding domain-containing protein [Elusimicrobiota bacterium]MDH5661467.1 Lrp/AsnC ligand binding domain-containing protein [Elusimicrobiota bacterium]
MVSGLVFVRLLSGHEEAVMEALRQVSGVQKVIAVFGRWDLVVSVQVEDIEELASLVINKIRAIPGTTATETLIAVRIEKPKIFI